MAIRCLTLTLALAWLPSLAQAQLPENPFDEIPRPETRARRDAPTTAAPPPGRVALPTLDAVAPRLERVATIIATGRVHGDFARPVCEGDLTLDAGSFASRDIWGLYGNHLLLLDTGGLFARHGIARFASRHDPTALAELASSLGYHALAFSEADLGDPREILLSRVRALRDRGIPTVASNLRCSPGGYAVCEAMLTGERGIPIARRGDQRIAILSYVDPDARTRVAPDRIVGVRFEPIATSLARDVAAARERGATLVVATIDLGTDGEGSAKVLALASELEDAARPDVVFVARGSGQPLFARPMTFRPAIASAPPRGAVELRLRNNRDTGALDIFAVAAGDAVPAAPFIAFNQRVGAAYCDAHGQALPGGQLGPERPIDAEGLTTLVQGILRQRTRSDVAFLNADAIDRRWVPAREGVLTASDAVVAVRYDEPIVTASVTATWLRDAARSMADRPRALLALGLTIENARAANETIKVLGRPIELQSDYRVVTNRFLAQAGEGLLPPGPDWEETDLGIRSALLEHLEPAREVDPRDAVREIEKRVEWTLRAQGDLTFSGSAIRDEAQYREGPLVNARQLQLGINTLVAWHALHPQAAWENHLTSVYTMAATATSDGFEEGIDQVLYRTSGNYRGFRARRDERWVPDLVAEGLLRTELTRRRPIEEMQEDGTTSLVRQAHFLTLRFAGGFQWRLLSQLRLRALGGFELLEAASAANRAVLPGYGFQLFVDPWVMLSSGQRSVTAQLTLDWFASDPRGRRRHLLQGLFDLKLQLTQAFGLALNVTLYGLKSRVTREGEDGVERLEDGSFGFAMQTTIGIRVSWFGRAVMR